MIGAQLESTLVPIQNSESQRIPGVSSAFRVLSRDKYYNGARTHRSLNKDAPVLRAVQAVRRILPTPILGGLHHQYVLILFPTGTGQGIVDFIGLTKTYNIAILVHGISLSLRGSGRLDTRLDTPPISHRHHPVSRLALGCRLQARRAADTGAPFCASYRLSL